MKFTTTWAGGEHEFSLPFGQLRAVQDKCDAGPAYILGRLSSGQWRVDDVVEVIRHGLLGAEAEREKVNRLVKLHVEGRPLMESVPLATAILMSALYGVDDDPVGEDQAGAETPAHSREDDGSSPPSTELAQP
ncbi:gene transfer agent family protein [Pseudohoeflea suaedae]|uniref:Gene transfer agent family protein n=1 Tax=Pseudohoeflea suaedae TaxID=877384 RepID=A0A4R5PJH7_9HYPH|nr:gene transfer agent family protein [Pseudohoeflea suaedae]TDH35725.1 gene transfer agent family protein [Pseudohoeflea suaedae]